MVSKQECYEFLEVPLEKLLTGEKVEKDTWRFIRYSDSRDACIFMKRMR